MSHSFTLDCSTETLILRTNQTAFIKGTSTGYHDQIKIEK